jgi:DNA-binding response OmpR family regulator
MRIAACSLCRRRKGPINDNHVSCRPSCRRGHCRARDCGFTVFEASNGDEAKTLLTSSGTPIEIALADMASDGSGFALRQWMRENNHPAEIILAGSIERAVDRASDICKDGPDLAKPYEHHIVLDRIRRGLARRIEVGPHSLFMLGFELPS